MPSSAPTSDQQYTLLCPAVHPPLPPSSATHLCPESVPPISAVYQCRLSVPPH
ncbi:unnamed protein product [Staurois parvus]|uniref:Uncharacterized protein n=1 Tax=Staurois parvus TaxID=386267 RepID=A0ABN9B8E9_9NEOB|nr:unnamed protein product [Staurois parvus]